MTEQHLRITREKKTISKMVHVYCKAKHGSKSDQLCESCSEFLAYAYKRLDNCPFQEEKPTCGKCLVHCYQPVMKEKAKTIMRYSGPRLIYKSPLLALHHVFDGRKKPLTLKEFKNKQKNK